MDNARSTSAAASRFRGRLALVGVCLSIVVTSLMLTAGNWAHADPPGDACKLLAIHTELRCPEQIAPSEPETPPPHVVLHAKSGNQDVPPGDTCWRWHASDGVICSDSAGPSVSTYQPILHNEVVRFSIKYATPPKSAVMRVYTPRPQLREVARYRLQATLNPTWRVDLPHGKYVASLNLSWGGDPAQGGLWDFGIAVGRPLQVQGRRTQLANTGLSDSAHDGVMLLLAAALLMRLIRVRLRTR